MSHKLYIGNLAYSLTQEEIVEIFEEYGEVASVKLVTDRATGRAKGFGFVEMIEEDAAEKAIEALHEKEIKGRNMIVNKARPQEPRDSRDSRPRQGGGQGGGGYRGGSNGGGSNGGNGQRRGFSNGPRY